SKAPSQAAQRRSGSSRTIMVLASSMKHRNHAVPLSENKHLLRWVDKMAELTKPAAIHWVDGSEEERDRLYAGMIANGTLIKLNQKLWPGCYYARSDAGDVARVKDREFVRCHDGE